MSLHSKQVLTSSIDSESNTAYSESEVELWSGAFSSKSMVGSWIMGAAVSLLIVISILLIKDLRINEMVWMFGIGVIVLLWLALAGVAIYRKLAERYELSTQRLKHREGILFRTQNRMELIDIDDVLFRQGPVQALLNVGDIIIDSSDKSHPQLVLRGIDRVAQVVDLIDDARRKERRRRGLHVNH